MKKRHYMLVWSVWGLFIAAALLSACRAGDDSRKIAKIEDQIAKTQATVESVGKDRESLDATVVAGEQAIASLEATAEALRRDLLSQVDGDLQVPSVGHGEADRIYAVPTAIYRTDRGDGWTDYTVYVAFVNDSNNALSLNLYNVRPMIETVEGFTYTGNWISHWSVDLPAKFRSAGRMGDGEVYRTSFTFSSATSAHPSIVAVNGFGTIDLSQTPSITYPTTKLSSEFLSFGHSFSIPGKGTLMFGQPKLSHESTDRYPDVLKWTLEIPVVFQNASQGYNSSVDLRCELIDGNGLWIGPENRLPWPFMNVGPGMSESTDILFLIGISNGEQYTKQVPGRRGYWTQWERNADLENAKLVCRADEQEMIFSLPLLEDLQAQ